MTRAEVKKGLGVSTKTKIYSALALLAAAALGVIGYVAFDTESEGDQNSKDLDDLVVRLQAQVDQNKRFICAQGKLTILGATVRIDDDLADHIQRLLGRRDVLLEALNQDCNEAGYVQRAQAALDSIDAALAKLGVPRSKISSGEARTLEPAPALPTDTGGGGTDSGGTQTGGGGTGGGGSGGTETGGGSKPGKDGQDGQDGQDGTDGTSGTGGSGSTGVQVCIPPVVVNGIITVPAIGCN